MLDLACGKGAVSVNLAKKIGCMVKGIDIMPDFIDFAVNKAQEFGVGEKILSKNDGYIIIDDAYGDDKTNAKYPTREKWLTIFNNTGVRLIDEKIIEDDELASLNNEQQELIVKRANELKEELPEKAHLFDSYIQSQQEECEELENDISGVTLLLQAMS